MYTDEICTVNRNAVANFTLQILLAQIYHPKGERERERERKREGERERERAKRGKNKIEI